MATDHLHAFIRSLDKGEVAACRNSGHLMDGKRQERRVLFDTLLNMVAYDHKALAASVTDPEYLRMLPIEKVRMYRSLMATVMDLRRRRQTDADPWAKLDESRLLFDMGLSEQAVAAAKEGIAMAQRIDELFAELQLREHLRVAYKTLPRAANMKGITENEYRLELVAAKVTNLTRYTVIADNLGDHQKKFRVADDAPIRAAMDSLMADPLMSDMKLAISLPAQIRFAATWAAYCESIGNLSKALENREQVVSLWDSNPARIAHLPQYYRQALSNLMGLLGRLGHTEQFPQLLKRMEQVPVRGRQASIMAFCELEIQYQLYYMNTGQFNEVVAREKEVISGIRTFGKMMPQSKELTLLYNLGVNHLIVGNNRDATTYFSRIHAKGILDSRLDLQGLARLLRLLLLLEDLSADRFHSYLRSTRRTFKKGVPFYQMEEVVHHWLTAYQFDFHTSERKAMLMELYDGLKEFEDKRMVGAEELRLWALSRATGRPILELMHDR